MRVNFLHVRSKGARGLQETLRHQDHASALASFIETGLSNQSPMGLQKKQMPAESKQDKQPGQEHSSSQIEVERQQ